MKPTVGRIVHCYEIDDNHVAGPFAALVTNVREIARDGSIVGHLVDLVSFDVSVSGLSSVSSVRGFVNVEHAEDVAKNGEDFADGRYWCWRPREP